MMTRDGRAAELSAGGLPTLYIDFDGTLHESARVYGPAFRSVYEELTDDGLVPPAEITEEMIRTWLGTPSRYPWDLLAPDLDPVLRDAAIREVGGRMNCLIDDGIGRLFPGTEEALDALAAAGYPMVLLSNSTVSYIDMNRRAYGLDRWFSDYVLIEAYPHCPTKSAMLAEYLRARAADAAGADETAAHAGRPAGIVIGDRRYDMEAARENGLPFIACDYGYAPAGELDGADVRTAEIRELPAAVKALCP